MVSTSNKPAVAAIEPLLVNLETAAALCAQSRASWYRRLSAGLAPRPVYMGRKPYWVREELVAWVRAGCPPRDKWEQMWKSSPAKS